MELRHRILEFSGTKKYNKLKSELDKIGARYHVDLMGSTGGVNKTSIECWTTENDPLYPRIKKLIERYDLYVQTGLYYDEADINSAEWLYVTAGEFQYPQPEDTYIDETYDTSNYCQFCGMGLVQNRPFRLKSDFIQKRSHFLGLHWVFDEIFVRPLVKDILEESGFTGLNYQYPLLNKTGKTIETVYQVIINTVAPPGLITDGLQPVTCKDNNEEKFNPRGTHGTSRLPEQHSKCGRVKYNYPHTSMITFKRYVFNHMPDVFKSTEYFGSGGSADRLILVNHEFVKIVKKNKLRGLKFTPVKLV